MATLDETVFAGDPDHPGMHSELARTHNKIEAAIDTATTGQSIRRAADGTFEPFTLVTSDASIALRYVATTGLDTNDGLTWETPKLTIQAATDALPSTGGIVYIGAGTFVLANQASPTGAQFINCGVKAPSNVTYIGAGRRSTILTHGAIPTTGAAQYFTAFTNSNPTAGNSNICIYDIGFDLTYPRVTTAAPLGLERYATAVYFAGAKHCRVERCWIKNGSVGFIPGPTAINTATAFDQNIDNVVSNNIIENMTISIFLYQGRQMWCEDNWIDKTWDDPILLGSAGRSIWIQRNYVNAAPVESAKGGSNGGIYVVNDGAIGGSNLTNENMEGIWIIGNRVLDNNNRDTTVGGAQLGIGLSKGMRNVWVEGNNVSGCERGIQYLDGNGKDIFIRGNSAHHNDKQGIRVQSNLASTGNVSGLIVEDNTVYANQLDAAGAIGGIEVYCNTGSLSGAIRKNRCYDDQTTPTQTTALRIGSEAGATVVLDVSNNNLSGTTSNLAVFGAGGITGCRFSENIGYDVGQPFYRPAGLTGATTVSRYTGGTVTGAPTTGTFAIGDFVVAQNGHIWVCTVAGTPGTWVDAGTWGDTSNAVLLTGDQTVGGIKTFSADRIKIGSIILIKGTGSPEGVEDAPVGSMFFRSDGSGSTATYRKESGTGNLGWVAQVNDTPHPDLNTHDAMGLAKQSELDAVSAASVTLAGAQTITGSKTFGQTVTFSDGANIVAGATNGIRIATAPDQKFALWGAATDVQPANIPNTTTIITVTDLEAELNKVKDLLRRIGAMAPNVAPPTPATRGYLGSYNIGY